ncbi:hypothetical protein [Mycobacterium sp. 852002-51057_SCH5723018]|uniref:hypothetical protein n=1 Tax=Mycobacterium sp. 852002-51057_SCH5723018 TaxID=1834094 RepID=UPI000801C020|nr:hypothetical protein [Mycobacterium sp. 852002-51057_SCH5723018]OBG28973.1 hypothetical protein A5764_23695 [Mycobacterium sp. 852002-51057_SCH5723018]
MQLLRVDTAAVQEMAGRWAASVGELTETEVPAGVGLSFQASAAAVTAAHTDVTSFTAALATRVGTHATHVGQAEAGYLANEADAAKSMAAVAASATGV